MVSNLKKEIEPKFGQDIIVAALIFMLGSKINVISALIHKFYSYLFPLPNGETHDPKYISEFSLLAFGIGVFAVVIIRLLTSKNDFKDTVVIMTGAVVGVLAAIFQILELTFLKGDFPLENFLRVIFYILMFSFLFFWPLLRLKKPISGYEKAVVTLTRFSVSLVTSFVIGLIASIFIVIGFKLFESFRDTSFSHIANGFEFNPLAYVSLTVVWVIMGYINDDWPTPKTLQKFQPKNSIYAKSFSLMACILTAFLYGSVLTQMDPRQNFDMSYVDGMRYIIIAGSTMVLFLFITPPIETLSLKVCCLIFAIVSVSYFLAFVTDSNMSLTLGIIRSGIFGLLGILIYSIIGVSQRISNRILISRLIVINDNQPMLAKPQS